MAVYKKAITRPMRKLLYEWKPTVSYTIAELEPLFKDVPLGWYTTGSNWHTLELLRWLVKQDFATTTADMYHLDPYDKTWAKTKFTRTALLVNAPRAERTKQAKRASYAKKNLFPYSIDDHVVVMRNNPLERLKKIKEQLLQDNDQQGWWRRYDPQDQFMGSVISKTELTRWRKAILAIFKGDYSEEAWRRVWVDRELACHTLTGAGINYVLSMLMLKPEFDEAGTFKRFNALSIEEATAELQHIAETTPLERYKLYKGVKGEGNTE